MFLFLKDLLFPKSCFSCHKFGSYLCYSCQSKLKVWNYDICPYCRKKSYFGLTHPLCKKKNGLDGLKSFMQYDGLTRILIKQIKYRLVRGAIGDFVNAIPYEKKEELLLYKRMASDWNIIPVPLHSSRFKLRGFNQSEEIAPYFSNPLGFIVQNQYVKRIKNTIPQVETKSDKERSSNIRNAFEINDSLQIAHRNFIIFDDVFTTGSTIFEITKMLKKNEANRVMALTLAR